MEDILDMVILGADCNVTTEWRQGSEILTAVIELSVNKELKSVLNYRLLPAEFTFWCIERLVTHQTTGYRRCSRKCKLQRKRKLQLNVIFGITFT